MTTNSLPTTTTAPREQESPAAATMTLNHCFVRVDDIDAALGFYHGLLGLPIGTDVTLDNGYRWTTVTVPRQPGLEIGLEEEGCLDGATDADRTAMTQLRLKGLMSSLIFSVDDVDATFERLAAAGAEVLQEPMDQFYGVRDCAFRDPAGTMVRFNQALGARSSGVYGGDQPTEGAP